MFLAQIACSEEKLEEHRADDLHKHNCNTQRLRSTFWVPRTALNASHALVHLLPATTFGVGNRCYLHFVGVGMEAQRSGVCSQVSQ